ncbi:MAG: hypothetical protein WBP11_02360 [Dokdonella sp.]
MSGLRVSPDRDVATTIRTRSGSWLARRLGNRFGGLIERHPAASFVLVALLVSLPLLLNPGYFSHDELQWLAFADRDHWGELPWQDWFDFSPFQYRPLTFNSWLLFSKLFGYQPLVMHGVVVTLGLLNAWLLRACLIGTGVRVKIASGAALLFLLTPSAMQVHGWVGTLGDLYCLLAALIAMRVLQRDAGRVIEVLVVAALTIVALWSKESALVFPALLLAAWPQRRWSLALPITISAMLVLGYLALRWQTILYSPRSDNHYAWSLAYVPARLLDYAAFPFLPDLAEAHVIRLSRSALRWIVGLGLCASLLTLVARVSWRVALFLVVGCIVCLGPTLLLDKAASVYAYLATAWTAAICGWSYARLGLWPRRLMLGLAAVVALHGALIGARIVQIGMMQRGSYAAIETLLPMATEAAPIRLAPVHRRDYWALQRLFHQVPSWRRVALGERVMVVAVDEPATLVIDSDGTARMPPPRETSR